MRILASIALLLAGLAAIGYSYLDAYAAIGRDIAATAERGEEVSAFNKALAVIMSGELPQPTSFIYLGLLFIAIGVVVLIMNGGKKHDDRDPV